MCQPRFSIIIPVHNGGNFIGFALRGMLAQSYPYFDITILENASCDRTVEIIRSFDDPRIKVLPSKKFLSIEQNWARILDLELNEYACIFCHDDMMYPGYLEEMSHLICAEPDASLYHSHYNNINSLGEITSRCQPMVLRETGDEYLANIHRFREDFCGTGYVFCSADFKRVGGFPSIHKLLLADAACWYLLSSLSYRVVSPKYLYAFRLHDDSTTRSSQILDSVTASRQYLEFLAQTPHFNKIENQANAKKFINQFLNGIYKGMLYSLVREPDSGKIVEFYAIKDELLKRRNIDPRLFEISGIPVKVYEAIVGIRADWLREIVSKLILSGLFIKQQLAGSLKIFR